MYRTAQNLPFATHDGVVLGGDLYLPKGEGPHPVLIAAPGGGWLRGDKGQLAHWGNRLAENGIAVFAVDYRRSTDGKVFPQNAQDVLAAAQFIDGRAGELGLDRGRMGLLGASAGAHLVALVALAGQTPVLAGGYPEDAFASAKPAFRVLVGVYGIYDLPAHWRDCQALPVEAPDDMVERMIGGSLVQDEQAYLDGSPISHLASGDKAMAVMLIWGGTDTIVLPTQSEAFAAALGGAGYDVSTLVVPDAGHFWFSREPDFTSGPNGQVAGPLVDFLHRELAKVP